MKKTFEETIRAMSAGDIIMSMVEGLENPVTEIKMSTYGFSHNGICYGCAATNTVCRIAKIKFTPDNIYTKYSRAKAINSTYSFLELFEMAIDALRCGDISCYNKYAELGYFSKIQNPTNLNLPHLGNNYIQEKNLYVYKQLANTQK